MKQADTRQLAGKRAKQSGDLAEELFQCAARYYAAERWISYRKTNPPFVPLGEIQEEHETRFGPTAGNLYGFFDDKSTADWVVTIRHLRAASVWIETKRVTSAQNSTNLKKGLHQFDQMNDDFETGGAMGFYLVMWDHPSIETDWRLYPISQIVRLHDRIRLYRRNGIMIPATNNWPEWYTPVFNIVREFHEPNV